MEFRSHVEEEVLVLKAQPEKERGYRTRLQSPDNMPDGMMFRSVRDLKTGKIRFVYVSETCEKLLGVPPEKVLADLRYVYVNIDMDDIEIMMQRVNEPLYSLRKFEVEVRYQHPATKSEHWLQISSFQHCEGDFIYAEGFIFDITSRKQTEQLIIEKERMERMDNIYMSYANTTWKAVTDLLHIEYVSNITEQKNKQFRYLLNINQ